MKRSTVGKYDFNHTAIVFLMKKTSYEAPSKKIPLAFIATTAIAALIALYNPDDLSDYDMYPHLDTAHEFPGCEYPVLNAPKGWAAWWYTITGEFESQLKWLLGDRDTIEEKVSKLLEDPNFAKKPRYLLGRKHVCLFLNEARY